jgi:altronate hydrolase
MTTPSSAGGQSVQALRLDPSDNVAVATGTRAAGDGIAVEGCLVILADPIPLGHKFALEEIPPGGHVRKYGEVIGVATDRIVIGAHVHVHNVVSARLPGAATG